MKIVIIAGGAGTRIASIAKEIPKPMIPINGKPVLEYQVELAKRYGYTEIILLIGHLGDKIKEYFGSGARWGVSISYYVETSPLGTAGAVAQLSALLTQDFFVFYGDTVMDIALDQMLDFHKNHQSYATLLLHPNDHPYDSDLVEIAPDKKIVRFYPKPHNSYLVCRNLVNAALYILSPKILSFIPAGIKSDFAGNIFPACLNNGVDMYGYISPEYIKDMGTPDRYEKVGNDLESGKVARLNKKFPRPAIFLDRDGVICVEKNLLSNPEQLELINGVPEAIHYINQKEYLVVIVTDQPVIARNLCSIEELDFIHKKLETLLGRSRAYVDAIYYCPHHPDAGYSDERKGYKIICDCRKPKAGMLLKAAIEWNIDLPNSYMIGDRDVDVQAGFNAGVTKSFLINTNQSEALLNLIKKII
jgi:mannose-1-phosphate guanylyltransferase / phosphomannomutase